MTVLNKDRIFEEFKELVAIPCHSTKERQIFEVVKAKLEALGFTVEEDDAASKLDSECGNMWAFLPGNKAGATKVLLSGHLDGVEPCGGTTVVRKDGILYSDGTTILGSDDKSGVVAIIEGVRVILEENAERGDIQVLFTIAEEGGVNGSRRNGSIQTEC